ncbi:iron-containing alcohol dehydrogenase [Halovenus sp. WSH3]|uniref:Iron-containing alcohol dehydrogenase n=1 Tax=Halovenus carboxidivorans TaxID=2692199 RepID=A0A6B0SY31_9EURY|nr:iron-containing alcohol dehydrogenase family protein [Halovenus carboxidivorans]MXR50097.1 iron-containing alcohol dehydrogenase [Halovenus carboxidivorans]
MDERAYRFEYDPGTIRQGRGCVEALSDELAGLGCERAMVVCGQTVGSTEAVMGPITDGLGDRLAGIFDETTPKKRLSTVFDGARRAADLDADALVAVGGGSSLDVAKGISAVAASESGTEAIADQFEAGGLLPVPDADLLPMAVVPTTLAGADLSIMGGITAHPAEGLVDEPVGGGIMDPRLMPAVACYDPDLLETTPRDILAASAMNGFDKGIESLYAANATPVTDAAAVRGLSLLSEALPTLSDEPESWASSDILEGIVLVQYGISRPGGTTLSLIHAFGHGLTAHSSVQQGAAHAMVAPHALAYLFEHSDGRRDLLARAFDVDADGRDDLAAGIVEEVVTVRDALALPAQLREIDDLDRDDLEAVAQTTIDDSLMGNCPPDLDATTEDLLAVLESAW